MNAETSDVYKDSEHAMNNFRLAILTKSRQSELKTRKIVVLNCKFLKN